MVVCLIPCPSMVFHSIKSLIVKAFMMKGGFFFLVECYDCEAGNRPPEARTHWPVKQRGKGLE